MPTKEEKRKIKKLKRRASRNRNRHDRRKSKVAKIKARSSGKASKIKAHKSARINKQKQKTARVTSRSGRVDSRTSRKLERQETKQDKITAKYLSGAYTPEAIEARMSGYGDIAGSVAEGAVEGALGGGSVLDLFGGDKDEDGNIIEGSGSSNITKYLMIGGAALIAYVILTNSQRKAA
jgi:hypothetical protein